MRNRLRRPRLRRLRAKLARRSETVLAACYFLGLAMLVFFPVLTPGSLLSLDMVVAPGMDFLAFGLETQDPLYYGRLPVLAAFDALGALVPVWVVQRLALLALVAGSGLSAHAVLKGRSSVARLFAGTLYAINPFVYARLLAGHWFFLLGYAVLPVAAAAVAASLRAGPGVRWERLRKATLWTAVVAALDPHALFLLAVLAGCLAISTASNESGPGVQTVARRLAVFGVVAVGVNAFWLLPASHALVSGSSLLSSVTHVDLAAFSARGTVGGNVPLSVATLYGFWRGGSLQPVDVLGLPLAITLYAVVLFLAVYGWAEHRQEPLARAVGLAAIVGFVLAMGLGHPVAAPAARWLFEHVFVLRGMRDTQKFAALLALAYAYLGGLGLDSLAEEFLDLCRTGVLAIGRRPSGNRQVALAVTFVCLLMLVPLAYSITMFGGLWGQLQPTDYPEEWQEADAYLDGDPSAYRVLFVPWHQYMDLSFTDRRVANPADVYFDERVIRGRNIELAGIESQATDPTRTQIRALLTEGGDAENLGHRLSGMGFKYVVVAREVDYRQYDYLREHEDLTIVLENDRLTLLRNEGYASPGPAYWPRAGPPIPWTALALGSAISAFALAGLARPDWTRRRLGPAVRIIEEQRS